MNFFDGLRCEYLDSPLGIDTVAPRFRWCCVNAVPDGAMCRVRVVEAADDADGRPGSVVWLSEPRPIVPPCEAEYTGSTLAARRMYDWCVELLDRDGELICASESASFRTGFFTDADWDGAHWIGHPKGPLAEFLRERSIGGFDDAPLLRRNFDLDTLPTRAFAAVASIGYHELYVNGVAADSSVLSPNVSDLKKRVLYRVYDVQPLLRRGRNTFAVALGVGWSQFPLYEVPDKPLLRFHCDFGKTAPALVSDGQWRSAPGPSALLAGWTFYHMGGEYLDGGRENANWNRTDFDDSSWSNVRLSESALELDFDCAEPNVVARRIDAAAVEALGDGEYRIDMGEDFSGFLELALEGVPGTEAEIFCSERPDERCSFDIKSVYRFGASGRGVFRNRFNYSVGRWITVTRLSAPPIQSEIHGFILHNDYESIAEFSCSDERFNRIYQAARKTFESLTVGGYHVDCPNRERFGYGAEGRVGMYLGMNNYDWAAVLTKWAMDWRDVQKPSGDSPYTAPTRFGGGGPAWCGILVAMPFEQYLRYGDTRMIRKNWPHILRYFDFMESKCVDGILRKWGGEWDFLGDWLNPGRSQANNREDEESTEFFNNCSYLWDLRMAAALGRVLGENELAARWNARADALARAAHKEYYRPELGTYVCGKQTYSAFALACGVVPKELEVAVRTALENDVERCAGHLDTGVMGTYLLLRYLAHEGRGDLACRIVGQPDYPGFLDMFARGATTLWEQWDGEQARLHSSFTSVGGWMIEGVLGLQPDWNAPGYRNVIVRCGAARQLAFAAGRLKTASGVIFCRWHNGGGRFVLDLELPPLVTATILLDGATAANLICSGSACLDEAATEPGTLVLRAGAGKSRVQTDALFA